MKPCRKPDQERFNRALRRIDDCLQVTLVAAVIACGLLSVIAPGDPGPTTEKIALRVAPSASAPAHSIG